MLAYLLWLVSCATCVVGVIQLRAAIAALWAAFGGNHYTVDLVSQVSLLLAGTGPVVLLRRFAITIAMPLGVIALSLVLLEVGLRGLQRR